MRTRSSLRRRCSSQGSGRVAASLDSLSTRKDMDRWMISPKNTDKAASIDFRVDLDFLS